MIGAADQIRIRRQDGKGRMREERAGRKGNGNTAGHKVLRTEGRKKRLWKNSLRENGLWETELWKNVLWKAACLLGMATLLIAGNESLMLTVYAEPAALRSPEATVYEQAGEGSNPVGNLVEGSTFDYIGDVTAEDGSVWHQITTSNGTTGYIRGDREIETGVSELGAEGEPEAGNPEEQNPPEGESAPGNPEGQNPPEGEGAVENPEGQNPAEGQGAVPEEAEGQAPAEEPDQEDGEEDPDGDDLDGESSEEEDPEGEEDPDREGGYGVENHRTKSYTMGMTGRIKGKEDAVPAMKMDMESMDQRKSGIRIDKTLFLSVAVILFCAGTAYLCWKKISGMRPGAKEQEKRKAQEEAIAKIRKKSEKKKRSQKKKVRKK